MRNKPFYESKTFWGIMMTIVAPTVTQLSGVDVTSGIQFLRDITSSGVSNYSFFQWLQIVGQGIGTALTIYGTISSNRKPLKFKDDE
jgi:hypothetical protein